MIPHSMEDQQASEQIEFSSGAEGIQPVAAFSMLKTNHC
jgi:hypothetical protein